MSKSEEYRAKADECEKKATAATDVEAKRLLQEAALEWRNMAAHADRHGWFRRGIENPNQTRSKDGDR